MSIKSKIKKYFFPSKFKTRTVGSLNESTRVNWLEKTLKKIPDGNRILDAGAGEQQFRKFCKHLNYISQDFAQYKPDDLKSGLQVQKWDYGELDIISDIALIPEKDSSFDAVMCTEVFEHIINPREAIKEFSRLLKKDGILVITAPFCSLTHFAPYHYYTGFSKFFYEFELDKNGFDVVEISPNGNYFEYLAQEINRLEYVAKEFTNTSLHKNEIKNINNLIILLQKLTEKDNNSSELLCFGYNILAIKK